MGILSSVLDFNENVVEIRKNMYDNTDMGNWVMYLMNLEIWSS